MSERGTAETQGIGEGERIAKVIARSGVCSRRDAERMIEAGRVSLNGAVLKTPAVTVTDKDRIEVDGASIATRERTRLWLFHKPKGLVTTNRDPEGRRTVFAALPRDMPRVLTVGRLDINTEGLLLLTNDGGLARVLELPSAGWLRRYRVRAHGRIEQPALDALAKGVTIEGMIYGGIEAALERQQGSNVWVTIGLREGKNREVKRVMEHLGLGVNRLIRVSYGPFQLGDLQEGEVREVRGRVLRDQLGDRLAGEAGADFEAPIRQPAPPTAEKAATPSRSGARKAGKTSDDKRPSRTRGGAAPVHGPDKPDRSGPRSRKISGSNGAAARPRGSKGPPTPPERPGPRPKRGGRHADRRRSP